MLEYSSHSTRPPLVAYPSPADSARIQTDAETYSVPVDWGTKQIGLCRRKQGQNLEPAARFGQARPNRQPLSQLPQSPSLTRSPAQPPLAQVPHRHTLHRHILSLSSALYLISPPLRLPARPLATMFALGRSSALRSSVLPARTRRTPPFLLSSSSLFCLSSLVSLSLLYP